MCTQGENGYFFIRFHWNPEQCEWGPSDKFTSKAVRAKTIHNFVRYYGPVIFN